MVTDPQIKLLTGCYRLRQVYASWSVSGCSKGRMPDVWMQCLLEIWLICPVTGRVTYDPVMLMMKVCDNRLNY